MVTIFWRRKTHLVWKKSGKIKNKYPPSDRRIVFKWDFLCTLGLGLSALVVQCTVGWSDLALFCDFRKRALCCQSDIFLWVQFQKRGNLQFTTKKNYRGLKNWYFCLKMCKYLNFTSKNNRKKEKFGNQFGFIFL